MLTSVVDAFHSFASSADLADSLRVARREFITLRGDLFDSDSDYEARLGVFLDWFICDRKVRIGDTTQSAASYFIEREHTNLSSDALAYAEAFRDSSLRLLLFKKLRKMAARSLRILSLVGNLKSRMPEVFVPWNGNNSSRRVVELHGDYFVSPFWMPTE